MGMRAAFATSFVIRLDISCDSCGVLRSSAAVGHSEIRPWCFGLVITLEEPRKLHIGTSYAKANIVEKWLIGTLLVYDKTRKLSATIL